MTGFSSCRVLLATWCCAMASAAPATTFPAVTLTPSVVEAGSPELIRVDAPHGGTLQGEWLGRKLEFFRSTAGDAQFALAGVDVEAPTGPSRLEIELTAGSARIDLSQDVLIQPAHYRTSTLTVAPRYVAPGPAALRRIAAEKQLKASIFSTSASERLWRGRFQSPVHAVSTDSFGTRRLFDGKLASIHKGLDFRARPGTPVVADNAGIVVLARNLYYEGNCVILDHGMGLFAISMHLSSIRVHEGQRVQKGQLLGLSGATGRVTGPHLHWAVRWEGAYLDPARLLQLHLGALQ